MASWNDACTLDCLEGHQRLFVEDKKFQFKEEADLLSSKQAAFLFGVDMEIFFALRGPLRPAVVGRVNGMDLDYNAYAKYDLKDAAKMLSDSGGQAAAAAALISLFAGLVTDMGRVMTIAGDDRTIIGRVIPWIVLLLLLPTAFNLWAVAEQVTLLTLGARGLLFCRLAPLAHAGCLVLEDVPHWLLCL